MKPKHKHPRIKSISPAIGYLAGYAGDKKEDDRLYGVIVWAVMNWPDDSPDEVVGQVFNGQYITEADAMANEDGVGSLIGYFTDDEEGRKNFLKAADTWRQAGGDEGDDEGDDEGEEEEWDEDEDDDDEDDFE